MFYVAIGKPWEIVARMNILNFDAPFLVPALRHLGHEVYSVGANKSCDHFIDTSTPALRVFERLREAGFTPDAALFCDAGNLPIFPGLEELPCPTAFYSIDTYCNTWHMSYGHAFDTVFVAQRDHVHLFASEGIEARWLPLFARHDQDCCRQDIHLNTERDIPVAFVGTLNPTNIPDRLPFLEDFRKRHPLLIHSGAYVEIFNRSAIVLNQTAFSELNFRCFEAMACGAALLMEHAANGLELLFTVGEDILPTYKRGDAGAAAAIAQAALSRPASLAALAKRGHDKVHANHLDIHRARHVVTVLNNLAQAHAHEARLHDLSRRRRLVAISYGMLADGLIDPALREHATYFKNLSINLFSR